MDISRLFLSRTPRIMGEKYSYGILAPLFKSSRGWELVFEQRAQHITQGGEVSFPGGAAEPDEPAETTSVRETYEELGIAMDDITLWGPLDTMAFFNGMVLRPFIGELDIENLLQLKPNPDEVERVFSVPLDFFLDHPPETYTLPLKMQLPEDFPYELIPGGKDYPWTPRRDKVLFYHTDEGLVWGLTARIVENLVHIIKNDMLERRMR